MKAFRVSREWRIVCFLAILFAGLNLFHVFYWAFNAPPNTVFIGITHWYEDYFFYLSQLTQGAMGRWQLTNAYTLEPIPLGYNWIFNLLLGKIAGVLAIPPWRLYDGAIFVLSAGYICLSYRIILEVFGPEEKRFRIPALLIALMSTQTVFFEQSATGLAPKAVTYFYAYTDAWNRLGGVAHQIAQNILGLYAIILFSRIMNARSLSKTILLLSITVTSLFVISAFFAALAIAVFGVVLLYYLLFTKTIRFNKMIIISIIVGLLPVVLLGFYQKSVLDHPFWVGVRLWEQTRGSAPIGTFLLSSGVIALLLPIGILKFLKKATPIRVTGVVYAFLPIVLYFSPIPGLLGMPAFRLLQPPAYVFFGAIAAMGIAFLANRLGKSKWLTFPILLGIFLAFQIPGLLLGLQSRINEYYLNSQLNFLNKNVYNGLVYLKAQPHNTNVLAVHTLESLVPVVSGHSVYEGHATLTVDYKTKIASTIAFYARTMTPADAYRFLQENTIGYVLWEKRFGGPPLSSSYPFLSPIFDNPGLVIYRFTP